MDSLPYYTMLGGYFFLAPGRIPQIISFNYFFAEEYYFKLIEPIKVTIFWFIALLVFLKVTNLGVWLINHFNLDPWL